MRYFSQISLTRIHSSFISMMVYRKTGWKFWVPAIASFIGGCVGFIVTISFLVAFYNVHVAVWGCASGILASLTFCLHCFVRHDRNCHLNPNYFIILMAVGVFGHIIGWGGIIGYLAKGILDKETGIQVGGSFIVTVWAFMTLKWGFFLYYHARNYKRELLKETPCLIGSLQV